MTPPESLLEAFPLCDVLSAAFLLTEESTVLLVGFSATVLGVAELFCSAEDEVLKADIGIFICIGPRLLDELYSPEGPTVGREVLVACTIECAVGTACTASVVPRGAAVAEEFL